MKTMKAAVTVLVFCVAALLALGMVMLYSSSAPQSGMSFLAKQLIWCGAGFIGCFVAAVMDYRSLKKVWWILFGISVVMLILVLIPHIGTVHGKARRWFNFAGLSFQPSEVAKLALLVALAWYGERFQRQMPQWKKGMVIPGLMIAVVVGLIFKEPDVGNALVIGSVGCMVLLIAGMRVKYFLPPVIIALTALGIFIYHNPMRSERIYSWLHLEETKKDKGLQAYEAMIALGSGGPAGKGLGDSRQKHGFVPEQHTDFILSIIGEELGLAATLGIVVGFIGIVICGIYISVNSADTFGLLLGSGLTFLMGIQAFVNIGVVTSALPNKGLPLPFISYGGSNLLVMLVCVGVLLSISRHAKARESSAPQNAAEKDFDESNPFRRKGGRMQTSQARKRGNASAPGGVFARQWAREATETIL